MKPAEEPRVLRSDGKMELRDVEGVPGGRKAVIAALRGSGDPFGMLAASLAHAGWNPDEVLAYLEGLESQK